MRRVAFEVSIGSLYAIFFTVCRQCLALRTCRVRKAEERASKA